MTPDASVRRRTGAVEDELHREERRAAVAKAIAAGQTADQVQKSVLMDAYKD